MPAPTLVLTITMVLKSNLALEQNTQVERISAYRQQPGFYVRMSATPTSQFKLEIPTPMSYLQNQI
jgi:hypothetical protein